MMKTCAILKRLHLNAIQEHSKKYNGYVLYLHSKGVSNPADESKAKWRRLMMEGAGGELGRIV
jgi:hypothetical protein